MDMKISEVAQRAGVTTKTVRNYAALGLVTPVHYRNSRVARPGDGGTP